MITARLAKPTFAHGTQSFGVVLSRDGAAPDQAIVTCAYYPPLDDDAVARLIAALRADDPGSLIVAIREDREGWSRTVCTDDTYALYDLAAVAVATVKAAGGWDESDPIVVEVNTYAFDVTMRCVDGTWRGGISAR